MIVILSQHYDYDSSYSDEVFNTYHYPARYKNQLHEGDTFIYYQGNRYDKSQRYYFGTGIIGKITIADEENYYAKLINCKQFEKIVPIYFPDGGYIEQLGYETVRKSINPPWQSSVRPLSQEAYDYIIKAAGIKNYSEVVEANSVDSLKAKLKTAVREYFVGGDLSAIPRIESIASTLGSTISMPETAIVKNKELYTPAVSSKDNIEQLIEYCRTMKMSYSYKPLMILALFNAGNNEGAVSIKDAAKYFYEFYSDRRSRGLPAEKKKCIYLRNEVTIKQIMANLVSNPVKALLKSGYFSYIEGTQSFSFLPEIWSAMQKSSKATLTDICMQRLKEYYDE